MTGSFGLDETIGVTLIGVTLFYESHLARIAYSTVLNATHSRAHLERAIDRAMPGTHPRADYERARARALPRALLVQEASRVARACPFAYTPIATGV